MTSPPPLLVSSALIVFDLHPTTSAETATQHAVDRSVLPILKPLAKSIW
jgi:hypothetical protein